MKNKNTQERFYDAFISYRHLPEQQIIALKLQELLERLTIQDPHTQKKRKLLIFRDKSELPVSEDLSVDIKNALYHSSFLIILVSPEFQESNWCMKELSLFRAFHGNTNSKILPLLVKGEPDNAFPEVLKYKERRFEKEDGVFTIEKEKVEPNGADIRGESLKEQLALLCKYEYLRIAAPILGTYYDALFQRQKRAFLKRLLPIIAFILIIGVLFGMYYFHSRYLIAQKEREAQKAEALRLFNQAVVEDNNIVAISQLEQSLSLMPNDDDNYTHVLYTMQEKILTEELLKERSPLKKEYSLDLPFSDITLLHTYKNGSCFSLTDGISTYLYEVRSGKELFQCKGTEVYFPENVEFCIVSGFKNGYKTITGYRIPDGNVCFSWSTEVKTQAPSSIQVWFDQDDNNTFYLYDMDNYGNNSRFFAKVTPDFKVIENPIVPQSIEDEVDYVIRDNRSIYRYTFNDSIFTKLSNDELKELDIVDNEGTFFIDDSLSLIFKVSGSKLTAYIKNSDYMGKSASKDRFYIMNSPDGKRFLSLSKKSEDKNVHLTVCSTDTKSKKENSPFLLNKKLYSCLQSEQLYLCTTDININNIFYLDNDAVFHLFDSTIGQEIFSFTDSHPEEVQALAVNRNHGIIAVARKQSLWEYEIELYSIKDGRFLQSIDCSEYVGRPRGSTFTHLEISEEYLFACTEEDSVLYSIEKKKDNDSFSYKPVKYFEFSDFSGNNSDPLPRYMTADGLLFFGKNGIYSNSEYRCPVGKIYDINRDTIVQPEMVDSNFYGQSYCYDSDRGILIWQESGEDGESKFIHIARRSSDGTFVESCQISLPFPDLKLPTGKAVFDGQYLLLENDSSTVIYNIDTQESILSLGLKGLAINEGRIIDISQETPNCHASFPIYMTENELRKWGNDLVGEN